MCAKLDLIMVHVVCMEVPLQDGDQSSGPENSAYVVNKTAVVFDLKVRKNRGQAEIRSIGEIELTPDAMS